MISNKKECIAMLLAGGQGTRLGVLTRDVAKPAVPFGGKYRIIDFPLSNCVNSGIDTVGVLTQYQPFELNQYIGNGQPWDLDRLSGGVYVLPPYVKGKLGEWYKGTANAIYQNIMFIDRFNPEYVLILSGDHIYKMDYSMMIKYHKNKEADCTIATIKVPMDEASRFGILSSNPDGRINEFQEKPKHPASNNASMGIYVFNWKILREYLIRDEADKTSQNDFGKDIIPKLLAENKKIFSYSYSGYWKDVGTVSSLWEANMDLLTDSSGLDIEDRTWKIFARNSAEPPQFVEKEAVIKNSIVSEGSVIRGKVIKSIISHSCQIGKNTEIIGSVILPGAKICDGATIYYSIVGENAEVGKNAKIGVIQKSAIKGEWNIALVGPDAIIPDDGVVGENEMIEGGRKYE